MGKRTFSILLIAAFSSMMGLGVISPFITELVGSHKANGLWIAMLFAGFAFSRAIIMPFIGRLSDRFGRVPIIIATSFLGSFIVYMLNWAPYYWGIAALMILLGIATYSRMPVSEAFIISHTTQRNRSLIYGIYYSSMTEAGAVFAPIMGYLIENYGFSICFNWAAAAIVAITLVCAFLLRGSRN